MSGLQISSRRTFIGIVCSFFGSFCIHTTVFGHMLSDKRIKTVTKSVLVNNSSSSRYPSKFSCDKPLALFATGELYIQKSSAYGPRSHVNHLFFGGYIKDKYNSSDCQISLLQLLPAFKKNCTTSLLLMVSSKSSSAHLKGTSPVFDVKSMTTGNQLSSSFIGSPYHDLSSKRTSYIVFVKGLVAGDRFVFAYKDILL